MLREDRIRMIFPDFPLTRYPNTIFNPSALVMNCELINDVSFRGSAVLRAFTDHFVSIPAYYSHVDRPRPNEP